jgi:hypothetical protein
MIHCDTIYVQTETVWWSTVILYMYSQRQSGDPLLLYMYSQRQCDEPLWYYICIIRDNVMIHCDAIYVQLETVWWSTVILYMYSQRQCDDPLWWECNQVLMKCNCKTNTKLNSIWITLLSGVTFYPKYTQIYPNTALNYIISIILRCFMNN